MSDIFAAFATDPTFDSAPQGHVHDFRGQFTDAVTARQFMRAGKATVTLVSKKTGTRFTYKLTVSEDGNCIFVGLLVGQNNETDYQYIGRIARDVFWAGRKTPRPGDIAKDAPSVVAFAWAWRTLAQGTFPSALEIWHEGACGRCGRKLTVPTSVARGFGPECAGKVL
jgi:hypothetical protein